ncbi:hypothetical protein RYX36_017445 [Vicia faba]
MINTEAEAEVMTDEGIDLDQGQGHVLVHTQKGIFLFIPKSGCARQYLINFTIFFVSLLKLQQFTTLPVLPVQAMTQQSVSTFFSQVMATIGGNTSGPGDSVVNVYINHDKKFAFVEMRSIEEANNAMALNGIIFQIRELLETFGPFRGFDLVKDRETGNSKGYTFCVYQDISVTDIACATLNGIKMGDKTLTISK